MIAAFEALREEFRSFGENGISMVLVCAAILFGIAERKKLSREAGRLLSYGALLFVLVANPFGYQIIQSFWLPEYRKIFMVVLPTMFVAFAATELIAGQAAVWKKMLMAVCLAGIVAASAFFDFDFGEMNRVGGARQAEQEIADVDVVIRAAGIVPENMIAPREVCVQIRKLDAGIELLLGESVAQGIIDETITAANEEEQQYIDDCKILIAVPEAVDYQIVLADKYQSNCIVVGRDYDVPRQMEEAGFECYGGTSKYMVYFRR